MYEVVRSAVTGPESSRILRNQHADKHDTPPSHFKLQWANQPCSRL